MEVSVIEVQDNIYLFRNKIEECLSSLSEKGRKVVDIKYSTYSVRGVAYYSVLIFHETDHVEYDM